MKTAAEEHVKLQRWRQLAGGIHLLLDVVELRMRAA